MTRAREARLLPLFTTAKKHWNCLYQRLETDPRTGFLGGMTSRAAAHIRRIAMILALMDCETEIRREHLRAAEAIWDYSQDSAQYIFLSYDLNQAKIIRKAEEAGANGITATDVHILFSRNKPANWIQTQMTELVRGGFLSSTKEQRAVNGDKAHTCEVDVYRYKRW